jgi:HPt (histidine-containing phosphotransfer) domain-containing protein
LRLLFVESKSNLRLASKTSVNPFHAWLPKTPPARIESGEIWTIVMPLYLQRIEWMPSPPLVPDDGPIDLGHLKRMTLGDESLEREVLAMFSAQSARLIGTLAALPEARELAHTLKGSARAIGAFAVADAADALESVLANGEDPTEALAELTDAVTQARTAIDAQLRRS